MISLCGVESSHLGVMSEAEIVPATGQLELFCDRGGIPAGLVRGTLPIATSRETYVILVFLQSPPVSDQPEHRSFEPARTISGF